VPRIDGPNPLDVFTRSERFVDLIDSAVWHTLDAVTGRMRGVITVDSIAGIYTEWQLYVTALRDHVGQSFIDAARQTQVAQRDALIAVVSRRNPDALLADAGDREFEIPLVTNPMAESLMANAENRLSNVGNEVWESARGQLLTGMQNGEGINSLRSRVMSAADFGAARAELVARTELAHAVNAGSLAQMKQLGVSGMTKQWVAVHDGRTRVSHAQLDGMIIGLEQNFPGGIEPGGEPNCRCTYTYDIPDEELASVCDCASIEAPPEATPIITHKYQPAVTSDAESWFTSNIERLYSKSMFGVNPQYTTSFKNEDVVLTHLAHKQFGHKPTVGTSHAVDNAVKNGWIEVWRGSTKSSALDSFRDDPVYPMGKGVYGNGIYTSRSSETAAEFRAYGQGKKAQRAGSLLRMAINPSARIVDYDELQEQWKLWEAQRERDNRGRETATNESDRLVSWFGDDMGIFATMRGYDVIRVRDKDDGTGNSKTKHWADQYVILNRSAVLAEDTNR
jgi:SPP1 gp7 family putative phage head morphogenesis protein